MTWIVTKAARPLLSLWAGAMAGIILAMAQELGPLLVRFIAHPPPGRGLGPIPFVAQVEFLYACEYGTGIGLVCAILWYALKGLHHRTVLAAIALGFLITFAAWTSLNLLGEDLPSLILHSARLGLAGAAAGWVTWRLGRTPPAVLQPALTSP